MCTVPPSTCQLNDDQREFAIGLACKAFAESTSHEERVTANDLLSTLVKGRSPEAIRRLEEKLGLWRPS